ncbi:MAG: NAD(P)-binding domain-containing protein [Planctomycetota bacterium]
MDPFATVGVVALLVTVLALLGRWQHRIDTYQRDEVLASIYEARERGTDQALAQYPHIDEQSCIGCGSCIAACPEEQVIGLVNGVARVVHGARCIGHARCADVCPVGAIQVGLGDTSGRTDIPILSDALETSRRGIYIAGELGGLALIRIAIEQGVQAVGIIANELRGQVAPSGASPMVDVLVVGAGPAGLAAGLEAKRLGLSALVIDREDLGGTVRKYPRRKLTIVGQVSLPLHGLVKQPEFLKEELIDFWEAIIAKHEIDVRTGLTLNTIDGEVGAFTAKTSGGIVRARRVILALGRRGAPRKLGVPGEDQEKVLYQLIDASTYRNEHLLVVGGGDSAIEAATGLADQTGNTVTLSYRRENFFRLKARNEERIREYVDEGRIRVLFESKVVAIDEDFAYLERVKGGEVETVKVENAYTFVFAGGEPPYAFLRGLGVEFGGGQPEGLREARIEVEA